MRIIRNSAGNVLITFALLLPVLLGMMALAFDIANLRYNKSQLQLAADASALAGVDNLLNQATALAVAQQIAQANTPQGTAGIVQAGDVQLGVYNTATKVFQATTQNPNAVFVHTARDVAHHNQVPTFFTEAIGLSRLSSVSASSIAIQGNIFCHYLLDPSSAGSLQLGGGVSMNSTCGFQINSNSAAAITTVGFFDVHISATCVVGSYFGFGLGSYTPAPTVGCPSRPDPLQNLPEPAASNSCQTVILPLLGGTLNPGCYSGLITIAGNVTLNPGLYQFQNAQVVLLAAGTINGSGVALYFNSQSTFTMFALAAINISAPSSGTYQGISIFYSRSAYQYAFDIIGGGVLSINGTIYAPSTNLTLTGVGASTGKLGYLITNRLIATGLWTINLNAFPNNAQVPNAMSSRASLVQ